MVKYEETVQGLRSNKASAASMLDYVQKYNGEDYGRAHVSIMVRKMLKNPQYGSYFENSVSVEECSFIKHCILRILRGNYNFYYKETLRKLHAEAEISEEHFTIFSLALSDTDRQGIMTRFRELQGYICSVKQ